VKQGDLRDMFKNVSNSVCTSTVVVSPDALFPTPYTSSALKTLENVEGTLMALNQQLMEICKWNTSLISCMAQVGEQ
jgi:hypothetical protein